MNIIDELTSYIKESQVSLRDTSYMRELERANNIPYETRLDIADDIYNWFYPKN